MNTKFVSGLGLVFSSTLIAANVAAASDSCTGTPHTQHAIVVNKDASCVLSKLYETQMFCLANADGDDISGAAFDVVPGIPSTFGLVLEDGADFNMQYALTCVKKDGATARSPKVIFTIGADGPAVPNISVMNLYGARGSWTSTGYGENYSIRF